MSKGITSIPGLTDNCLEIFEMNDRLQALYQGRLYLFEELPVSALEIIREDLEENTTALQAIEAWGIDHPLQQLRQYAACRYGSFDLVPDFDSSGHPSHEYINCQVRDNCPFDGTLCAYPKIENGQFTRREMQVLRMITRDLPDKQIADLLNLSHAMIAAYRKRLEDKIGCQAKPGVAYFAGINNVQV